jgi:hypothetical protein
MNLVERYIEAVKFWLPAHLKDDVAAELADDINSEIEEAERGKGRRLTDDEIATILKARGRPMLVASRYLPKRTLIGPELYPIYILVLKIVALCSLVPLAIMLVATIDFGTTQFSVQSIGGVWNQFIYSLLTAFAIVTLIFAVIEHHGMNPAALDKWNPKALRPVRDPSRIRRSASVGEIAANMVLIAIFAAGYLSQTVYDFRGGHITVCPEWVPYWQIVMVLAVAEIALAATNLFKPFWSWPRILARAAIDLGKLAAFIWLLQTHIVREVVAPDSLRRPTDMLLSLSNAAPRYGPQIAIIVVAIIGVTAIWRLFHLKPAGTPVPA